MDADATKAIHVGAGAVAPLAGRVGSAKPAGLRCAPDVEIESAMRESYDVQRRLELRT
jgi:hypothetical protein